jgi:hypothetical protein
MDTADPHVLYVVMAVVIIGLVGWVVWVLVRPELPPPPLSVSESAAGPTTP